MSLTLPLAREFASFGVRVVCIAPGVFETPMVGSLTEPVRVRIPVNLISQSGAN